MTISTWQEKEDPRKTEEGPEETSRLFRKEPGERAAATLLYYLLRTARMYYSLADPILLVVIHMDDVDPDASEGHPTRVENFGLELGAVLVFADRLASDTIKADRAPAITLLLDAQRGSFFILVKTSHLESRHRFKPDSDVEQAAQERSIEQGHGFITLSARR